MCSTQQFPRSAGSRAVLVLLVHHLKAHQCGCAGLQRDLSFLYHICLFGGRIFPSQQAFSPPGVQRPSKMLIWIVTAVIGVSLVGWWLHCPPSSRDARMPYVPITRNLMATLRGENMFTFYQNSLRGTLQEHGVAMTFVGGKWAVMVTDPAYIAEIFKNELVYSKGGFRKRVPWGYFAYLFGDNIIDSHGSEWRKMMMVMKAGITDRAPMLDDIQQKATRLVHLLMTEQDERGFVEPDSYLRRYSMSVNGWHFLDCDFGTLEQADAPMEVRMREAVEVRPHTVLTQYPYFEKQPWALLTRRRQRGFHVVDQLRETLMQAMAQRKYQADSGSVVNALEEAADAGVLSRHQLESNLVTIFVASHENAQLALNSILWALANHQDVQERVRQEILDHTSHGLSIDQSDLEAMPLLLATIYEVLRHYPPLFQMTNRYALQDVVLAGRYNIRKGTWISWNARAAHMDERYWPDGSSFKPERWGDSVLEIERKARQMQSAGAFITFSSHARKCLGKRMAMCGLKAALARLLVSCRWRVDERYEYKMPPVSRTRSRKRLVQASIDFRHRPDRSCRRTCGLCWNASAKRVAHRPNSHV